MRWTLIVTCVCGVLLGCGGDRGPGAPAPESAPPPPPAPPAGAAAEETTTAEDAAEHPPARPAEVGVGRKGHGYGTGPIAAPLAARWRTAERLVFDVQIPHAMNAFKAIQGRAPGSHEEFMQEIIDSHRIDLPELPEGRQYQYDPDTEQLMVIGSQLD